MSENKSPIQYFVSGGFGGVCTVLVGHPLDTIKVRLQTQPQPTPGQPLLYTGTLDCARKIIVKEGPRGFYKGMAAPLIGVAPIFATSFMGYALGVQIFHRDASREITVAELFAAGAFSGIFTTAIMAPGERIKCLLQIQADSAKPKYSGPRDAVKQLYKEGGMRSIYKGTCATLLRDVPASGMYFMTYELIKKQMESNSDGKSLGVLSTIVAGGCAGVTNWLIGMPADVLKSRLQTAPEGTYPGGIRQVFAQLMKQEGPMALYKGIVPVMLRAFPANAACFGGVEICKSFLNYVFH